MSILQQSMVAAREKGQDEQHEDDSETGVPAAVDWVPMFENKDRAGTGKATADDLKGVLEEVRDLFAGEWGRGIRFACMSVLRCRSNFGDVLPKRQQ